MPIHDLRTYLAAPDRRVTLSTGSRGEVIVRDGEFLGEAGQGRFVERKPHLAV